jgi:hypothetical protein
MTLVRLHRAFLVSSLVVGLAVAYPVVACQLVDPASTLDKNWAGGDGGDGGTIEDASSASPGPRCYVDVVDEQPIFDYCTSGQICCYSSDPLGTGVCQAAACENVPFACSAAAQCPSGQVCCASGGLNGDYLVLQVSRCADACASSQDLILCDLSQSSVCPAGMTCHTNGPGNRPLGYDSCN